MSHHHEGDAEYMADECEMEDVEDDVDDESIDDGERGGVESDTEEFDYSVSKLLVVLFYEHDVDEYVFYND